ncbi:MAG: hypothetical protein QOK39_1020 [Acidimicrobiaceae bacterium]|nr:hypothetical protein [Acidimicrobiaceae bacterium]
MPSSSRLVNLLAAACVLLLVAGVLFALARPSRGTLQRVAVAARPRSAAPTTSTARTATTAAPTTRATMPVATTVTATTIAATTTTAAAPEPDAAHRAAVATASFVFVDNSRATPAAGADPGSASRTLPTLVRYPADGPDTGTEVAGVAGRHTTHPFPLVVFASGYDSSPAVYATLLHSWASAGYVVAAPSFPRATSGGPLNEDDVNNQPLDLSFVITNVVALAAPGGPLAGLVDTAHVGVAGHSDGASTTAGIGYNSCCRDGRVSADAVMEGDLHNFPGGHWFPAGAGKPLLVIQGDHDALNPPVLGEAVYAGARSPKYLLGLVNGQHLEPYTTDVAHLAVVEAVTTAFFDRYLKGRADGVAAMHKGTTPGLATLTAG